MEEGRLYMLRAEQYALHEDYIFVEGPLNGGRVYLTCIPLQQPTVTTRPGKCLRSLIMVMMASVTELAGSGVQRLLQYCGGEDFTPAGLRDLLSELLTEIRPVNNTELPPEIHISEQQCRQLQRDIFRRRQVHMKQVNHPLCQGVRYMG